MKYRKRFTDHRKQPTILVNVTNVIRISCKCRRSK
nr:MAG TPA: hypothetical protein [Caudoviricetes sp.]